MSQGIVVHIPNNLVIEEPICIYNCIFSEQSLINPYLLIVAGENSSVEFLDITTYDGKKNWTNFFYEVYLESNSNIKMSNLSLKQTGGT